MSKLPFGLLLLLLLLTTAFNVADSQGNCGSFAFANRQCRRLQKESKKKNKCKAKFISEPRFECVCRRIRPDKTCTPSGKGCKRGFQCCNGICRRTVTLEFQVVPDNRARVFVCNKAVFTTKTDFQINRFRYTGPCDDAVLVEVENVGNIPSGTGVAILIQTGGMTYGTSSNIVGVTPFDGLVTFQPRLGWQENRPSFDYSRWMPVVESKRALIANGFLKLRVVGALTVAPRSGPLAPGIYGYRFEAPFCDC